MSKFIALKSGILDLASDALDSGFSNLKQQVLLFDQIGIVHLTKFQNYANSFLEENRNRMSSNLVGKMQLMITDLEWLHQMDIIFEPIIQKEIPSPKDVNNKFSLEKLQEIVSLLNTIVDSYPNSPEDVNVEFLANLTEKRDFSIIRLISIFIEVTKGITAVTTRPYIDYTTNLSNSVKSDVTQVIIKKLPLPSNETPWEQVLDYRNDPENQNLLKDLRRWIRKTSSESTSQAELEEEIEWLINKFQNHMKYHKIKANTETLEVLVKAPLEIVEDLVRLKLSKIPEPFFALKKRQLMLMEAEMNAPGRELAYIIKSREAFESQE